MMNHPQPLDMLMTRCRIENADLVRASTEQLTFKMVQKGRKGRRLTPNIQEKIWNALLRVRPELRVRPRELFHYPMDEAMSRAIDEAMGLIAKRKILYPQFVDRLAGAGVRHYGVTVAANEIVFYGPQCQARVIKGSAVSQEAPGVYDEAGIRSAIDAAQKELIDHAAFLKKIHEAGVLSYEVNLRERKITYLGKSESYREDIPIAAQEPQPPAKPEPAKIEPAKPKPPAKRKIKAVKKPAAKAKRPAVKAKKPAGRKAPPAKKKRAVKKTR